jgi:hypothetical protein
MSRAWHGPEEEVHQFEEGEAAVLWAAGIVQEGLSPQKIMVLNASESRSRARELHKVHCEQRNFRHWPQGAEGIFLWPTNDQWETRSQNRVTAFDKDLMRALDHKERITEHKDRGMERGREFREVLMLEHILAQAGSVRRLSPKKLKSLRTRLMWLRRDPYHNAPLGRLPPYTWQLCFHHSLEFPWTLIQG